MADSIRIAGADDAPAVLDLLRAAYQPLRDMGIRFTAVTADLDLVRRIVERHTTFLLERDGEAVATVSVRFPWPIGEGHLASYPFIHWFAVAPTPEAAGRRLGPAAACRDGFPARPDQGAGGVPGDGDAPSLAARHL